VAGEQITEPVGMDAATGQGGVGAAPAASMHRLQTQVGDRWDRLGAQQRVSQLQQGVGTAAAAGGATTSSAPTMSTSNISAFLPARDRL
jgi:hypothetical protein